MTTVDARCVSRCSARDRLKSATLTHSWASTSRLPCGVEGRGQGAERVRRRRRHPCGPVLRVCVERGREGEPAQERPAASPAAAGHSSAELPPSDQRTDLRSRCTTGGERVCRYSMPLAASRAMASSRSQVRLAATCAGGSEGRQEEAGRQEGVAGRAGWRGAGSAGTGAHVPPVQPPNPRAPACNNAPGGPSAPPPAACPDRARPPTIYPSHPPASHPLPATHLGVLQPRLQQRVQAALLAVLHQQARRVARAPQVPADWQAGR